jgi:transcriptional regulator with XRE-family HTH domain
MTGPELKDWLMDIGMSQADLARSLDTSPRTVNRWIKGYAVIPPLILRHIAAMKRELAAIRAL